MSRISFSSNYGKIKKKKVGSKRRETETKHKCVHEKL